MSNNHIDKDSTAPPPFVGQTMTENISLSIDDGGEEVTRRIGGIPSFNPNFSSTAIAPPSFSPTMTNNAVLNADLGASFDTTVQKTEPQTALRSGKKFCWVQEEAPTLPEFHPLERTAVFLPHTDPSKVSQRISDVLRDRSIQASYNNAKANASCVTSSGVEFRIFLYRGKNQYSHGIITEVQRRFGTSIDFYSDIKAILDAAEGKSSQVPHKNDSLPPLGEDNFKANAKASLKMVSKMMSHSGYDAQYLAMQTLASLTDPSKVGLATTKCIAKELVLPGNEVGQKVAGIVVVGTEDSNAYFGLRSMALSILANVLKSISGQIGNDLRLQLLPVLREILRNAENSPRDAHIATMCIEHLIVDEELCYDGLMEALEMAAQVGNARHAGLMHQAQQCLQKIRV